MKPTDCARVGVDRRDDIAGCGNKNAFSITNSSEMGV